MINNIYMRNLSLESENHILSFLYKPLPKRSRCCAKTNNNYVCKNKHNKKIFCHIHSKIFNESLKTSNVYDSVCLKAIFLRR